MSQPLFLVETAVNLILAHIQANIEAALEAKADIIQPGEMATNLQKPKSYFFYEALDFQAPGIFVIPEGSDFRKPSGANFVRALHQINIACVYEDRDIEHLTRGAWRYQSVLQSLLDGIPLEKTVGSDVVVKIVPKVENSSYSPIYETTDKNAPKNRFRKEVWLSCSVEHYEKWF